MKNFAFLFLFLYLLTLIVHAEQKPCYVQVESTGSYESLVVSTLSTSLIRKYINSTVVVIPISSVSENACQYRINITEGPTGVKAFVFGKDVSEYGLSELRAEKGLEQALLRAIYKGIKDHAQLAEICNEYHELLNNECSENRLKTESSVVKGPFKLAIFPGWIVASEQVARKFKKLEREHQILFMLTENIKGLPDKLVISHSSFRDIHPAAVDANSYGDIKNELWKGLVSKSINEPLLFEIANKMGVDFVFTYTLEPLGPNSGGNYVFFMFDVKRRLSFSEKGTWQPNKLGFYVINSYSTLQNRAVK